MGPKFNPFIYNCLPDYSSNLFLKNIGQNSCSVLAVGNTFPIDFADMLLSKDGNIIG